MAGLLSPIEPFALPDSRTGFLTSLCLMKEHIRQIVINPDLGVILGFNLIFLSVLGIISRATSCQVVYDHNLLTLILQPKLSASLSLSFGP